MSQHEITAPIPLLDAQGNLTEAGYAKRLLPVYDRSKVKGGLARLKEWDYYYLGNDRFGLALTIADNSYMGLDSISFLSFEGKPWEVTKSVIRPLPMGSTGLPETSKEGATTVVGKGYRMIFQVQNGQRKLFAHMDNFRDGQPLDARILLTDEPEESMVICTPFDKPGHFYYNQKINCMRASGAVTIGPDTYHFSPADSFAVLDWGRGVWTYRNTWYWGSASGLVNGEDFGFNIGYGFGDTSAATENMVFYKGKAHKLSQVTFHIPQKPQSARRTRSKSLGRVSVSLTRPPEGGWEDYLQPWTFTSDDGRFEMAFTPILNRASNTDLKVLKSDQNQVFGRFTGQVILDDGTRLAVKDLLGFAEKVTNQW